MNRTRSMSNTTIMFEGTCEYCKDKAIGEIRTLSWGLTFQKQKVCKHHYQLWMDNRLNL